METVAGLIKLKPEVKAAVDEWRAALQKRAEQAIDTLKDESVQVASWFEKDLTEIITFCGTCDQNQSQEHGMLP